MMHYENKKGSDFNQPNQPDSSESAFLNLDYIFKTMMLSTSLVFLVNSLLSNLESPPICLVVTLLLCANLFFFQCCPRHEQHLFTLR